MKPRDYQAASCLDTISTMKTGVTRPLIIAPTASGKSIIIAELTRQCTENNKRRVLVLCHQGHLLAQNEEKINALAPAIDTGIFCAGQGRKDRLQQVILASRDSLANDPLACGRFDLIICDEAHMIPATGMAKDTTNYGKIFVGLGCKFIIGLTGTPWRASGVIFGKKKFFQKVSYNIGMRYLIDEGYLSDYYLPPEKIVEIDASTLDVSRSTGDFKTADLDKISTSEEVVGNCIDHWERLASDRRCSIFFACSVKHAKMITRMIGEKIGPENVFYVDGTTKRDEREEAFERIKAGHYKCIVNIGVLTTGFDAPIIDCVVWMRATASASLFVQIGGRGLRTFEGKKDCLMLDMAGNFERFASIETPIADESKNSETEKKMFKECFLCGHKNHPLAKECEKCHARIPEGEKKKTMQAMSYLQPQCS